MREVVATLFSSVDGYATGRDPEDMDWAVNYQGPETLQLGLDAIRDSDLMVLGRVTYEIFAAYWPTASPEVEGDFAELMNRTPKMVFSKTLKEPLAWQNTKPVFGGPDRTTIELVDSRVLDGQVVLLDYHTAPARSRT
jgi:dihydrofolate reductase